MASFPFELVSPEKLLVSTEVEAVQLPGAEGEFEVMANHAPLLALLGPGIMNVTGGDVAHRRLFIDGGFCDVGAEGCTVLAEAAVPAEDGAAAQTIDDLIAKTEEALEGLEGEEKDAAARRIHILRTARESL